VLPEGSSSTSRTVRRVVDPSSTSSLALNVLVPTAAVTGDCRLNPNRVSATPTSVRSAAHRCFVERVRRLVVNRAITEPP
jgi:hypothetical protein